MAQTIVSRLALDGTVTTETIELPDPPRSPDVGAFKGIIRAKAKRLSKAGQYSQSIALLKTIGE